MMTKTEVLGSEKRQLKNINLLKKSLSTSATRDSKNALTLFKGEVKPAHTVRSKEWDPCKFYYY